jgi:FkbM family methyltransferase
VIPLSKLIFWIHAKSSIQLGLNSSNVSRKSLKKIIGLDNEPTIFDVGANIGEFSKMCRDEYKDAKIFAFEPQNSCHDDILMNAGKETIVISKAVSSSEGETFFEINQDRDRKAHINDLAFAQDFQGKLIFQKTTIDAFVKLHSIAEISLLKIDTEGHDFEVLKGAESSLKNGQVKTVLFEIMPSLIRLKTSPSDIESFLRDYGYYYFYRSTPYLGLFPINKLANYELHTQNIIASRHPLT